MGLFGEAKYGELNSAYCYGPSRRQIPQSRGASLEQFLPLQFHCNVNIGSSSEVNMIGQHSVRYGGQGIKGAFMH